MAIQSITSALTDFCLSIKGQGVFVVLKEEIQTKEIVCKESKVHRVVKNLPPTAVALTSWPNKSTKNKCGFFGCFATNLNDWYEIYVHFYVRII